MKSDRERAQEICEMIGHKWEETYYGIRCMNCGLFYPDGCEPWMPYEDDPEEEDYTDWFDLQTIFPEIYLKP